VLKKNNVDVYHDFWKKLSRASEVSSLAMQLKLALKGRRFDIITIKVELEDTLAMFSTRKF
jgi:hypothetical protein